MATLCELQNALLAAGSPLSVSCAEHTCCIYGTISCCRGTSIPLCSSQNLILCTPDAAGYSASASSHLRHHAASTNDWTASALDVVFNAVFPQVRGVSATHGCIGNCWATTAAEIATQHILLYISDLCLGRPVACSQWCNPAQPLGSASAQARKIKPAHNTSPTVA